MSAADGSGRGPGRASRGFAAKPSHRFKRWMYRGDRPRTLARVMNRLGAWQYAAGILTMGVGCTLEVRSRRTGRTRSFPLVLVPSEGSRYLVSMLGERAQWVQDVRTDDGRATLRQRVRRPVRLVEVPAEQRAPVLQRYLQLAPGARPHVAVDRRAPLAAFTAVAAQHPVFRVLPG